jgi:hypothetical protein
MDGGSGGLGRQQRRRHRRPSDAEFRATAVAAGDNCSACRRALHHREVTTFGFIGDALHVAGACCAARVEVAWGLGLYFAVDRPPPWREDDRRWFERHPARSHRLRRAFPGETANGQPATSWIVTRQIEPGKRVRVAFDPRERPPPDDEALGHALFDTLSAALQAGRDVVSVAEIIRQAAMLGRGGRA